MNRDGCSNTDATHYGRSTSHARGSTSFTTLPSNGHRQDGMYARPAEQHTPLMDERQLWAINQVHAIEALWASANDSVARTAREAREEAEHARQMRELRDQRDIKHAECAQAQHQLKQACNQIQWLKSTYDTSQGTIEGMKKDAAIAQTQQQALRAALGQQTTKYGIQLVKLVRLRIGQQTQLRKHQTSSLKVWTDLGRARDEISTHRGQQDVTFKEIARLEQIVAAGREVEANLEMCRKDLVRMTEDHHRVAAERDQSRSEANSLVSCLDIAKEEAEALKQTNDEQTTQHAEALSRVNARSIAYGLDAQNLLRRIEKYDRSDARARDDFLNLKEAAERLRDARTEAQHRESTQPALRPTNETRAASSTSTAPRGSAVEQPQPLGRFSTPATSSLDGEMIPAPLNGFNAADPPATPSTVASSVESGIVSPSSSSSMPGTPASPKVAGQSRG